ncbi:hypothetical protein Ga0074812_10485 [Parafrankia irregularis]|uniref:FHA domain-containing protein n=2 Tax=Frankiaceae TaxID=74712 RepID=A0A0S4QHQ1_9ACTN|nr:hypothetical protein Ga0074812_10485 [Parafrankia irregularis]
MDTNHHNRNGKGFPQMTGQVEYDGQVFPLSAGRRLTFGRSLECTVRLAAGDAAISRIAGSVESEVDGSLWWLSNDSDKRLFAVVDEFGLRSVVPPGRRVAVESPVRVVLEGADRVYSLRVAVAGPGRAVAGGAGGAGGAGVDGGGDGVGAPVPATGTLTAAGENVMINSADRLALVALFAGYLEDPPRYDPYPRSYAAAAKRLDVPRTTLVKRIEHLRVRLTDAGVPNLMGWNALTKLAEYAITTRLITRDDLRLLRR